MCVLSARIQTTSERPGIATVSVTSEGASQHSGRRQLWDGDGAAEGTGYGRVPPAGFADRMVDTIRSVQDAVARQRINTWPVSCRRQGMMVDHG
jgi:hypothetical protein